MSVRGAQRRGIWPHDPRLLGPRPDSYCLWRWGCDRWRSATQPRRGRLRIATGASPWRASPIRESPRRGRLQAQRVRVDDPELDQPCCRGFKRPLRGLPNVEPGTTGLRPWLLSIALRARPYSSRNRQSSSFTRVCLPLLPTLTPHLTRARSPIDVESLMIDGRRSSGNSGVLQWCQG